MEEILKIISVRESPEYVDKAIHYFQTKWSDVLPAIYEDCIRSGLQVKTPLPQWYLMETEEGEIIGGAGLITNDFISRMDLYPWICALFIDEEYRGNAYGALLLEKAKTDAGAAGFDNVYLCTDHVGYYERYGFNYIGEGYHPWGDTSRIYECKVGK